MIATYVAILVSGIVAMFALVHIGAGFRQRDNNAGYIACTIAFFMAFAAATLAILSLDDEVEKHKVRAEARIEARMGDLP